MATSKGLLEKEVVDIMKPYMVTYAEYANATRGAVGIDGLKHVQRRILISLYSIGKNKYIKAAQLVGHVLGHYHPHSDQAIYGALVKMHHNGLVKGQGNYGLFTSIDPDETCPAAMRYPEITWHPDLTIEMKYIKFADMIPTELGVGEEPLAIPVRLPLCLIRRKPFQLLAQGIGVGIKSWYPTYQFKDLVDTYLSDPDNPKFQRPIPDFGPNIELLDVTVDDNDFCHVTIRPKYIIDNKNKKIILKSNIGNIKTVIKKLEDNVTVIDSPIEEESNITIQIKPYKRIEIDNIIKLIHKYMTVTIHESLYVTLQNSIVWQGSLGQWVKICYNYRTYCAKKYYLDKLQKLYKQWLMTKVIEILKPHLGTYKQSSSIDDFISYLLNMKKITTLFKRIISNPVIVNQNIEISDFPDIVKQILANNSLAKLITYKADIEQIETSIKEIQYKIDNIKQIVLEEDYKEAK